MPNITLKDVTIKYKIKRKQFIEATNKLSYTFKSDQITCILGESGSGKTSLLRAIIGLSYYEGDIYFEDVSIKNLEIKDKGISYVSQLIGLYPSMSIYKNIAFPLLVAGCLNEEVNRRVEEVADLLKIRAILGRKPREISLGQAQRVAIARALVKKSNVYLFDEPFSNLDKPLSFALTSEIKALFNKNKDTVIFVSHDIEETFLLADSIIVMHEGKIVDKGTPNELLFSHNQYTQDLLKEFKKNHEKIE